MNKWDFGGWATKNDLRCADGRTIRRNAFAADDGHKVPLVWQHSHNNVENVLGHALLQNRKEGVYAYCALNDTEMGRHARELIRHGDINALSIYANNLKQNGGDVLHGSIKEVSLVLAGANPGALIDYLDLEHGEDSSTEAMIYCDCDIDDFLSHSEESEDQYEDDNDDEELAHSDDDEEGEDDMDYNNMTVGEVFNTLNDAQKNAVYYLVGQASGDDEGDEEMKHNVFENDEPDNILSHAEISDIISDARRGGSMKDAFIAHGIEDVGMLFPEAHNMNTPPEFIKRKDDWVAKVMNGVHHTPFSRVKSMFADLTEDEARAKGYIKGKFKKEEVFSLLKRTTDPTTIYKKQKMDRDDVLDITDFDVIAWLKQEMRMMLEEECARAILTGDGRMTSSDDKIAEDHVRPIWTDSDLFTVKVPVTVAQNASDTDIAKATIRAIIKSRKDYRGSGDPVFYTTEDAITDMLLIEDTTGRVIYDSMEKLKTVLRVKDIVTVPTMEGLSREVNNNGKVEKRNLVGLIVNLNDYNVGADKGGAVSMFDDFDIDYNAQKYLIETRFSGALIKPFSAMAIETVVAAG